MSLHFIRVREASVPLLFAACAGIGLLAMGSQARAATLSGNAALTSDYVWRGTTQTQGDAAVQAGFKLAGDSGFYGSAWGSNVEFAPDTHASSELDFTVGWGAALSDKWAVDVNLLRYQYPSTTVDLNWTELNGTLTYDSNYWLSMGYSTEALGGEEDGLYTQVGARFPINDAFRLEGAVGYYTLDGYSAAADSYLHGQLSAVWAVKAPLELRVTAHATDSNAEDIFGETFAGNRIEAALQASF
ncbi:TorF family putative porin [Lysobacter sp. S4-A87]|uniref:TorF family putative porin n=1 Tax=Lysobacter sp. S4-A87 TaxID=2925843 RepID=UPI001F539A94|nr:TorF family putative porin [Lysobacter sp. S4-A87]UNK50253.1 TorF family putative porin [Lysobacter sp. S4-A87]